MTAGATVSSQRKKSYQKVPGGAEELARASRDGIELVKHSYSYEDCKNLGLVEIWEVFCLVHRWNLGALRRACLREPETNKAYEDVAQVEEGKEALYYDTERYLLRVFRFLVYSKKVTTLEDLKPMLEIRPVRSSQTYGQLPLILSMLSSRNSRELSCSIWRGCY